MSRFSTTLDVSKELKGFEDDSGEEIEEEAEDSGSKGENKPKKGRNYAAEFETYDREDEMDDEMDELDSEFNGESKAKTVSENEPEKIVVEKYNVKKKQNAEFVDVDEVAKPKDEDDDHKRGGDDGDDDGGGDDSGDEGGDEGGEPRKVGNGTRDEAYTHEGKISWLWVSILIILIIAAGAAGYFLLKHARQHAAETNLSEFPEQIAKDNELLGQNLNISLAGELEVEPAAGENETEQVEPAAENNSAEETAPAENVSSDVLVEPAAPAEESNESALKDVLIQGLV